MKRLALIATVLALQGCGPTCQERGGAVVYLPDELVLMVNADGTVYPMWVSNSVCRMPERAP